MLSEKRWLPTPSQYTPRTHYGLVADTGGRTEFAIATEATPGAGDAALDTAKANGDCGKPVVEGASRHQLVSAVSLTCSKSQRCDADRLSHEFMNTSRRSASQSRQVAVIGWLSCFVTCADEDTGMKGHR